MYAFLSFKKKLKLNSLTILITAQVQLKNLLWSYVYPKLFNLFSLGWILLILLCCEADKPKYNNINFFYFFLNI